MRIDYENFSLETQKEKEQLEKEMWRPYGAAQTRTLQRPPKQPKFIPMNLIWTGKKR